MNTYVKWNTEKPKFEEVEGKRVLVRHRFVGVGHEIEFIDGVNRALFETWFDDELIAYAILSDEQPTCEWERIETEGICKSHTGRVDLGYFNLWKVCPECTRPIHIVEEVKPLPLMGIEPHIHENDVHGELIWYYHFQGNGAIIDSEGYTTKREAIESWNSLVGKLTGEK